MSENLATRVISCIAETQHMPEDKITIDSTFDELGFDSLDGINILFALETEFDIDISDEAAKKITSIREMVEGVRKLVDGGAPPSEVPAQS